MQGGSGSEALSVGENRQTDTHSQHPIARRETERKGKKKRNITHPGTSLIPGEERRREKGKEGDE